MIAGGLVLELIADDVDAVALASPVEVGVPTGDSTIKFPTAVVTAVVTTVVNVDIWVLEVATA